MKGRYAGAKWGFFTSVVDVQEHLDIFDARAVRKIRAMRIIHVRKLSESELAPLGEICDTMQRLLESDMWLGFVEADRRFHETVIALAGNECLIGMYGRAILPHRLSRSNDSTELRQNFQTTLDDHREIHRLLVAGLISEAICRMESHLEMSGKLVPVF